MVRFAVGDQSRLAIVLGKADFDETRLLILTGEDPELDFSLWQTDSYFKCASYGEGWCIELLDDEGSLPGNPLDERKLGTVRQTSASGIAITVRGTQPPAIFLLDLQSFKPAGGERHAGVLFRKWRIWKAADDLIRPKASPIFTYGLEDEKSPTP